MYEREPPVTSKLIREAQELGGIDLDDREDIVELPSFDKSGHRERSLANQPNHYKHWKKEGEVILYESASNS